MPRILLTGGAGYIGSHTLVALRAAGHEVTILDDFSNADPGVIDRLARLTGETIEYVEGSILDRATLDRVFASAQYDAVIHFAAKKAVGESVAEPLAYFETNIGGILCLMQAMKAAQVWRIVFSSTAAVYGDADDVGLTEDMPLAPQSPYGFSKLTCERILEQAAASDPWVVGILRYFNPAGAHPSGLIGEDPRGVPDNLMPFLAKVALGEQPRLSVFGDDYATPDGTALRDYIHVMDLARAHVQSLDAVMAGHAHKVNVGTGTPVSVLEMLAAYEEAVGRDLPHVIAPRRAGDVEKLFADPTRARLELGFEAELDVDDMCRTSWNWVQAQARGWRFNS